MYEKREALPTEAPSLSFVLAATEKAAAEFWHGKHFCLVQCEPYRKGLAYAFSKQTDGIMRSAWAVCLDCGRREDVTDWDYA